MVFACGGGIYLSDVAAAESSGGKVICSDVARAAQSGHILTSAVKTVCASTELALSSLYANGGLLDAARAGHTAVLGAAEDCIGLSAAEGAWRLTNFSSAEYEALYARLKSGAITVDPSFSPDLHPMVAML